MSLLGDDLFSSGNTADEFDFDAAASAFPDISLDGSTEIPSFSAATLGGGGPIARSTSGFSFDDFDTAPQSAVKVTGDDEIDKFESEFPEISPPLQVGVFLIFCLKKVFAHRKFIASCADLYSCNVCTTASTIWAVFYSYFEPTYVGGRTGGYQVCHQLIKFVRLRSNPLSQDNGVKNNERRLKIVMRPPRDVGRIPLPPPNAI